MGILNINIDQTGEVGIRPRIVRIETDNTVAEVVAVGFLNNAVQQGFSFAETDMALVSTKTTPGAAATGVSWFDISKSGSNWSLAPSAGPGAVALPSVTNRIATYSNTTGGLADDAATAINDGNIQAGVSGSAGYLASYPATAASGNLILAAIDNATGDFDTTINNAAAVAQDQVITIPDAGAATGTFMLSSLATPSPASNFISFSVTCGQAALAAAGEVALITSSGTKQYRIVELFFNLGGTNFAGGGGDRLGQVTDGTTVYSVVPAASMQTLANGRWGDTTMPYPAADAINTLTAAGADIVFSYSGGTTDYTAGSVVISGIVERVA